MIHFLRNAGRISVRFFPASLLRVRTVFVWIPTILLLMILWAYPAHAQKPDPGKYPDTVKTICGQYTTIQPYQKPKHADGLIATSHKTFFGTISVDPVSGTLVIQNAYREGVYQITLTATNKQTRNNGKTMFTLIVERQMCKSHRFGVENVKAGATTTEVRLGDFNEDGIQDLALLQKDMGISIHTGDGKGGFSALASCKVQSDPVSLEVSDVNGDGHLDLAVCNKGSNSFSVCFGDGRGYFGKVKHYRTGFEPIQLHCMDANSDGRKDFVIINQKSKSASIFLGDTLYEWALSGTILMDLPPNNVRVGFFDKDSIPDLAVINVVTSTIVELNIYKGNGLGGFSFLKKVSPFEFIIGLSQANLNADNLEDLLCVTKANTPFSSLFLLRQDRNFNASNTRGMGVTPVNNANNLYYFNLNGSKDLLAIVPNFNQISFVTPFRPNNDSINPIKYGEIPVQLDIGDLNKDGILDMVCTFENSDRISVILGEPDLEVQLQDTQVKFGSTTELKLPADFADMDTLGFTLGIRCVGTRVVQIDSIVPYGQNAGDFKVLKFTSQLLETRDSLFFRLLYTQNPGPAQRKTLLKIAFKDCLDKVRYFESSFFIQIPFHKGTYRDTFLEAGSGASFKPATEPKYALTAIAVTEPFFKGTLSVDPTNGVIRATNAQPAGTYRVIVRFGNNSNLTESDTFLLTVKPVASTAGNLGCKSYYPSGGSVLSSVVTDFNRDGIPDLAQANFDSSTLVIFTGTADGTFTRSGVYPLGLFPTALGTGDFNEDGFPDLVSANFKSQAMSVLLGNNNGKFTLLNVPTDNQPKSVLVKDINHDGHQDLLVSVWENQSVSVYAGNGQGVFNKSADIPTTDKVNEIFTADFNGDRNEDIGSAQLERGAIEICLLNSKFGVLKRIDLQIHNPVSPAIEDLNRDGMMDIVCAGLDSVVTLFVNQGYGSFKKNRFNIGTSLNHIDLLDLNGDRKPDLLGISTVSKTLQIYKGLSDSSFETLPETHGVLHYPLTFSVADVNRDGNYDYLISGKDSFCTLLQMKERMAVYGNNKRIFNYSQQTNTLNATHFSAPNSSFYYTLVNHGPVTLEFDKQGIMVSQPGLPDFVPDQTQDISIAPGDSFKIRISYKPRRIGHSKATVQLQPRNCNQPVFEFSVSGFTLIQAATRPFSASSGTLRIYPNPGNGVYRLELNDLKEVSVHCTVLDIAGHKLFSETLERNEMGTAWLNLGGLCNGTYYLLVNTGQQSYYRKLVKITTD